MLRLGFRFCVGVGMGYVVFRVPWMMVRGGDGVLDYIEGERR